MPGEALRSSVRATFVAIGLLCAAVPAFADGVGRGYVYLQDWAYDAIERFEALGMCVLPEDRPFTRTEFAAIVDEISRNSFDQRLSGRDRYNLARLEKEYTSFNSLRDPQYRYDPPTFYLTDDPLVLEGDVDLEPALQQRFLDEKTEAFVGSNPEFKLHFGTRATFDVRYRLLMGPEHGDRARNQKPSRREKSFKGLTSLYERGYVIVGWDKFHFHAGREYVDWGPSDWGNLITPGDTYSVDQIGGRVSLKMFRLSFFFGQLSPQSQRFFSGHRLEFKWRKTVFALSETAVYGDKLFDPVYAIPLSSFYANQFNERGNDNVVWSVDAKTNLFDRLTLYGSLLIDDFQFERDGQYPDKLAFDVGGRYALTVPVAASIRARYRRADIYTYTHKDSVNYYVSGEGRVTEGDVVLGGAPGPDADSWRLEVELYPRPNTIATAALFGEGRGEGNDFRAFRIGDDISPPFPSGVVQRTRGFLLGLRWEFDRNQWVSGAYSRAHLSNIGHDVDRDETENAFRVEIHFEFL